MSGAPTRPAPGLRTRPEHEALQALVPLRPQSPIEVVDRATTVFRTRIRDVLAVSASIQLTAWLLLAVLLRDDWASGLGGWGLSGTVPEPWGFFVWSSEAKINSDATIVLARLVPSLALAVTGAAMGALVAAWSRGEPLGAGGALRRVGARAHHLLLLWLLVHLVEIGTCVGVVVGPIFFGIAAPLLMIEEGTAWGTFGHSFRLARPEFGRMLGAVLSSTVVAMVISAVLSLVPLILTFGFGDGAIDLTGTAAVAFSGAIPHVVLDPLIGLAMALLALDLLVRREGADLAAQIEALTDHG